MEKTNGKMFTGIIAVLAVIGVVFGISKMKPTETTETPTPSSSNDLGANTQPTAGEPGTGTVTATPGAADSEPAQTSTSAYKDGTYNTVGTYNTPAGQEQIGIALTLKDGVVTNAVATLEAKAPESRQFQTMFINGFKPYVVGKSIDALQLMKVSGASLTPKGFNDAVAKIKVDAKA